MYCVLFMTEWLHCTQLSLLTFCCGLAPVGDVLGEEACPGVPCHYCLGGCWTAVLAQQGFDPGV